jgi:hypothetical protein
VAGDVEDMRYKIILPIQGDLFSAQEKIFVEKENYQYELMRDSSGKITHISISIKVPDDKKENFKSSIEPGNGNTKLAIHIGGDKELLELLCAQLRVVETELAFSTRGALWRIIWNDITAEFVPEDSSDEELLSVIGFSSSKSYSITPTRVSTKGFNAVIDLVDENSPLLVSKSFWQEGMNFFHSFNYIQAFYSFFFILEDFFAQGKTQENEVVKRFKRSKEFGDAAEYVFNTLQNEVRHKSNLQNFFSEEQLEFNVENLPKFLFLMRGRTHHYSSRNPKTQATPYSQKEFESISFLTMVITSYILANKIEKEAKETGKRLIFSRPSAN